MLFLVPKDDGLVVRPLAPYVHLLIHISQDLYEGKSQILLYFVSNYNTVFQSLIFFGIMQETSQLKKWNIVEVTPSVPKDRYRIRNLNGAALQMPSGAGVISLQTMSRARIRRYAFYAYLINLIKID
jgi:hypothetical protein